MPNQKQLDSVTGLSVLCTSQGHEWRPEPISQTNLRTHSPSPQLFAASFSSIYSSSDGHPSSNAVLTSKVSLSMRFIEEASLYSPNDINDSHRPESIIRGATSDTHLIAGHVLISSNKIYVAWFVVSFTILRAEVNYALLACCNKRRQPTTKTACLWRADFTSHVRILARKRYYLKRAVKKITSLSPFRKGNKRYPLL